MPRTCAFCGSTGPISGEDVLPRWLYKATGSQPKGTHIVGHDGTPVKTWVALPYHTTSRRVCRACNTGWMATLETATIPTLRPKVQGDVRKKVLTVGELATVARWALKTAMCVQLIDDRDVIPDDHYRRLYATRDTGLPIPGCHAWLGCFAPSRPMSRHRIQPVLGQVEIDGDPVRRLTYQPYVTTVAVGHVAIQTIVIDEEGAGQTFSFPPKVRRAPTCWLRFGLLPRESFGRPRSPSQTVSSVNWRCSRSGPRLSSAALARHRSITTSPVRV